MNETNKETQLLYEQIYASLLFIITIIVSVILTYNNILKKNGKKPLFNIKSENDLTIINRIIVTVLVIVFTYINYVFYEINKKKNQGTLSLYEFIASILTLIAGFILFYTTFEGIKRNDEPGNIDTPLI